MNSIYGVDMNFHSNNLIQMLDQLEELQEVHSHPSKVLLLRIQIIYFILSIQIRLLNCFHYQIFQFTNKIVHIFNCSHIFQSTENIYQDLPLHFTQFQFLHIIIQISFHHRYLPLFKLLYHVIKFLIMFLLNITKINNSFQISLITTNNLFRILQIINYLFNMFIMFLRLHLHLLHIQRHYLLLRI